MALQSMLNKGCHMIRIDSFELEVGGRTEHMSTTAARSEQPSQAVLIEPKDWLPMPDHSGVLDGASTSWTRMACWLTIVVHEVWASHSVHGERGNGRIAIFKQLP